MEFKMSYFYFKVDVVLLFGILLNMLLKEILFRKVGRCDGKNIDFKLDVK